MEKSIKKKRLQDFTLFELTQKYGESEAMKIWDSIHNSTSFQYPLPLETHTKEDDVGKTPYHKRTAV